MGSCFAPLEVEVYKFNKLAKSGRPTPHPPRKGVVLAIKLDLLKKRPFPSLDSNLATLMIFQYMD